MWAFWGITEEKKITQPESYCLATFATQWFVNGVLVALYIRRLVKSCFVTVNQLSH